jgi:peptidoglycan/LPS O-acetylase OafA/YrhL
MTTSAHRFHEIDLLRGVACAAVVMFHYLSHGPRVGWMVPTTAPMLENIARYGYLGVHLFFVISGFVILMSAQSATPREFVASRVARLYPALWMGASITAGTAWLLSAQEFSISLQHYLANLTMFPHWLKVPYVDGAYWSLAVEVHFYLYVWLAMQLKQMHRLEWLLIAWLGVSALNLIRAAWPIEFWLNAKWAPLFVAGGTFFLIRTKGWSTRRGVLLLASWILATQYAVRGASTDNPWIVAGVITIIYAAFLGIAFDAWRLPRSHLTVMAGTLTYPVYIIHQFFGAMAYEQIYQLGNSAGAALGLTTLLVVIIGWAMHRFVEKPLGPRLRKLIEGDSIKPMLNK